MSGLAEILLTKNFKVSGSDSRKSALTDALECKGARVFIGQKETNITSDIDLVVYTSAIHPDNPEYVAMKRLGIPCLSRAQLLGQIMKNYEMPIAISGTHGKTTTTSMISEILLHSDTDPTLSIGGILKSIHGNIRVGKSGYFVTEACEYTDSFLSFFPKIGIILNIEEDHLDYFKDIHAIRNSFHSFAALLPEDGTLIINGDIDNYAEITKGLSCRVITYGFSPACDYCADSVSYDELAHPTFTLKNKDMPDRVFALAVPGKHNISNAMAALVLSDLLSLKYENVFYALKNFSGTDRRFEYKGTLNGVTIIDDYAHHPTEITATLSAAKNYPHKSIWCVFQPHTYTRTKAFMDEFAVALSLADHIVLADIYAARENDTLGISSLDLKKAIEEKGHECFYFPSFEEIEKFLSEKCINGDLLITMGAGDVLKIGENLLKK